MLEHTLIIATWNIIALANRLEHFRVLHGIPSHWTAHRCTDSVPARYAWLVGFESAWIYANRVHPVCAMHHWTASMEYSENVSLKYTTAKISIIKSHLFFLMRRLYNFIVLQCDSTSDVKFCWIKLDILLCIYLKEQFFK